MASNSLMKILICPSCKGELLETEDFLMCGQCGARYPVKDEILVF